tara:strand:+ start:197 stop:517 length:321 start_codon:yes stop_codon:yes gene_type:complete
VELTVDIGQDVYDDLETAAKLEGKNLKYMASAMLSLGVKVFLNSKEDKTDPATNILLKNSVRSNEILTELLHIVFDKDKSNLGVYDADTALALIERVANKFMEGAE